MHPDDQRLAREWAIKLLERTDWCVLDTETTGLGPNDQICQIAIKSATGEPLLDKFVKPTVAVSESARAVHGISDQELMGAETFDQLLIPILKAVGQKDVVIFNADYDLRLIRQSLKPYGMYLAFPTSDRRGCRIFLNGGAIHCAMLWYSQFCGEWNDYHGNYKWQRLQGGNHSAMGDCDAVLETIRRMAGPIDEPESLEPDYDEVPY